VAVRLSARFMSKLLNVFRLNMAIYFYKRSYPVNVSSVDIGPLSLSASYDSQILNIDLI
jgi:hypothetical protein